MCGESESDPKMVKRVNWTVLICDEINILA
jgi:hypothetical protein